MTSARHLADRHLEPHEFPAGCKDCALYDDASAARRLELLTEHSTDVLCETREGTITYLSPNATRVSGLRPEAIVGRSLVDLLHPDDVAALLPLASTGWSGPIEAVFRVADASGAWQWREARGVRHRDDDGAHYSVLILRDINDRRRAEEALQRSEERANALLRAIPDLIFRLSRDGRYIDFKAEPDEDLYVSADTLIGSYAIDVLPADVAGPSMTLIERALDDRKTHTLEYQLMKHGEPRDYEARFVAIGDDEVVVIARDVTDRVKAETALVSSEEKYRKLVEGAHDIIYTTDLNGGITSVNHAVERILGYTPEELIGLTTFDLVDESQRAALAENYAEWSRTGRTEGSGEWLTRAKDGEPVWIETTATALQEGGRPVGLLVIGRDVTGRKRTAAEARDAEERDAIQRERARIAQELHDNVAQFFFGIGIASKRLPQTRSPAASTLRRKLAHIHRLAADGSREVRDAVFALSFDVLSEGLDAALLRLAQELQSATLAQVEYLREAPALALTAEVQREMYRAAREALYNVRKHAEASRVSMRLSAQNRTAVLTVSDDGVGDAGALESAIANAKGFGLRSLRNRFEARGGRLDITNGAGHGISVRFCLPVEGEI